MNSKSSAHGSTQPIRIRPRRPLLWKAVLGGGCAILLAALYIHTAIAGPASNTWTEPTQNAWKNTWNSITTIDSSNGNAGKIKRNMVFRNIPSSVAYDEYLTRARRGVEALRRKIEQWGTVTISAPVVVQEKGQFSFDDKDLVTTASNYIQMELTGVAGGSFVSNETAFTNSGALTAQRTFQTNPETGMKEPALDGSAAGTPPSAPTISNVNAVLSGGGSFANPGSLLSTNQISPGSIPVRAGVILGMNDKLEERIFENMVNPNWEQFANQDYSVYFAIVQVSCNPGWRTRDNYIADVSATLDYCDRWGNIMPEARHKHPLVFSVLPLLDAQNLELGSSDRSLYSLAGQLNASYPTVGLSILGQDLITFVHRYQKDNITRSPITVTNSYSSGRSFGFRLAPSFVAQKDPGYKKSGAADVLEATSFPVLIIAVVNCHDIWSERREESDSKGGCGQYGPLIYNSVAFQVSNRWIINDRPPLREAYRWPFMPLKQETFSMRCDWAEDVADIRNLLDEASTRYRLDLAGRRKQRDRYANSEARAVADKSEDSKGDMEDYSNYDSDIHADDYDEYTLNEYGAEYDPVLTLLRKEVEHYEAVTNAFPQSFAMFPDADMATPKLTGSCPSVPVRGSFSVVLAGDNLGAVRRVIIGGKVSQSVAPLVFADSGTESILCTFNSGEIRYTADKSYSFAELTATDANSLVSGTLPPGLAWTGSTQVVFRTTAGARPGPSPPDGDAVGMVTGTSSGTDTTLISSTAASIVGGSANSLVSSTANLFISSTTYAPQPLPTMTGSATTTFSAKFPSMVGGSGLPLGSAEVVLLTNAGAYVSGTISVVDYDGDKGAASTVPATTGTDSQASNTPAPGGKPGTSGTTTGVVTSGSGVTVNSPPGSMINVIGGSMTYPGASQTDGSDQKPGGGGGKSPPAP